MSAGAVPRQDDDVVPARPIVIAVVVVTAVSAGGVAWVALALDGVGPPRVVADAPVGVPILETPIDVDRRGPRARAADRAVLESYGWVDRERGIARIPIDVAMDLVAREHEEQTPERAEGEP